jgi:uncharacterized repeat protein (TIGR01451 family)
VYASASVTVSQANPGDNSGFQDTTVTDSPRADLSVTKSDGGVLALWGQPFTWTIAATNYGPDGVTGGTVNDTFPPGVTVKDFQSDVSQGYPNPKPGGQPGRFPTIIQIVPVTEK